MLDMRLLPIDLESSTQPYLVHPISKDHQPPFFFAPSEVLSLVKLVAPQLGFGRSQPAEALPQPAPVGVVAFKDLPGGLRAVPSAGGDGDFAGAKMRIKPREGGKIDGKFYEKTIVFNGERWQNIVWKG